jgi:hypothetical protein
MLLPSAVPVTKVNLSGSFDTGVKLIAEETFSANRDDQVSDFLTWWEDSNKTFVDAWLVGI